MQQILNLKRGIALPFRHLSCLAGSFPAVLLWASYSTSLCLSFLSGAEGRVPTSLDGHEVRVNQWLSRALHAAECMGAISRGCWRSYHHRPFCSEIPLTPGGSAGESLCSLATPALACLGSEKTHLSSSFACRGLCIGA